LLIQPLGLLVVVCHARNRLPLLVFRIRKALMLLLCLLLLLRLLLATPRREDWLLKSL
jgi:hypothetical protein